MNKISTILFLPIALLCFAFTTSSNSITKELKNSNDNEKLIENEGLRCVIRDAKSGRITASCWLCSCSKLAEAMK